MLHPVCISEEVVRIHRLARRLVNRRLPGRATPNDHIRRERLLGWRLYQINGHLIGSGFTPGQHVEVDGHIYRCSENGGRAVYVGVCLPDTDPWEAHVALEAALTRGDERCEWASYYQSATSWN